MRVRVVDTETSGTGNDAEVVELAVVDHATHESRAWRFRPSRPIDPGSTEIHGITDADVAGCRTFAETWQDENERLRDTIYGIEVWIGYNALFDLRVIAGELARIGVRWDYTQVLVVDPYRLWMQREKRKLTDAVRRFLGHELDGAHGAVADSVATSQVLDAMRASFDVGHLGWESLADECDPGRRARVGTKFAWKDGRIVYAFGKNRDKEVTTEVGYAQWMLRQDFASVDHEVAGQLVALNDADFYAWVTSRYPPPPPEAPR